MTIENVIIAERVTKVFGNIKVLDGIDLAVPKGTMLALLGPNGAGKTTTIKILSTLLHPDGGRAFVNGYDVVANPRAVKRSIGLTGQYAAVDEYLTGKENLELMGRLYHLGKEDARRRTIELLERFDLVHAQNRSVKTYSGGMRRKLDLAASLIAAPPVLFLDEPTTGLDPRSRIATWDIIKELMKNDITILLTTQQLDEADQLAHKIAVIDQGRIIAEGTSGELKQRVGNLKLELVVKNEQDMENAKGVFGTMGAQFDPERRMVSLQSNGDIFQINSVLDTMNQNGIGIDTFALRKPTLDDVFLFFTGHTVEANGKPEE